MIWLYLLLGAVEKIIRIVQMSRHYSAFIKTWAHVRLLTAYIRAEVMSIMREQLFFSRCSSVPPAALCLGFPQNRRQLTCQQIFKRLESRPTYSVFSTSVNWDVTWSILRLLVVRVVMTVTPQVCRCAGVCGLTGRQGRTVSCVSIISSVR